MTSPFHAVVLGMVASLELGRRCVTAYTSAAKKRTRILRIMMMMMYAHTNWFDLILHP